jgi:hypothetical protein
LGQIHSSTSEQAITYLYSKNYIFFYISCQYIILYTFRLIQNAISHNVPVICDVFLRAIKEMRSISSTQKNVVEQNSTKGVIARLLFCGTQTAEQAVCAYNPVICRFACFLYLINYSTYYSIQNIFLL